MFKNKSVYALAVMAALVLIGPAQSASAQSSLNDDTQVLISQIQADKRAVVLKNLALTDDQVRAFTPIYDEYQKERKKQVERGMDLLNKYASNYDSMTDDAAKDIMKDFFKLKDEQQATLKQFARKFARVLPEAKVLRFVQIENKLNAILDVQAARIVPLSQ